MPEYEPGHLETQSVKLVQHPFYDEDDELIHPAMYYDKFKEGEIVELVVSMEAMHLKTEIVSCLRQCLVGANLLIQWGTIRVHSLRILKVDPTDYSKPPLEPAVESEGEDGNASGEENGGGGNGGGPNEAVAGPDGAGDDVTSPGDQEAGAAGNAEGAVTETQEAHAETEVVVPEDDVVMADGTAAMSKSSIYPISI